MIKNNVYSDEWSGAGMYEAIEEIVNSEEDVFYQDLLDELLKKASEF